MDLWKSTGEKTAKYSICESSAKMWNQRCEMEKGQWTKLKF